MHFAPWDGHFRNLPIFRINDIKDAENNGRFNMLCPQVIGMPEYDALFVVNNIVHDAPMFFIYLIAHLF